MSSVWHGNSACREPHTSCRCRCRSNTRASDWIVAIGLIVLVEERLILELKAVEAIKPIHAAQILTYMKLARVQTGLLINFHVEVLRDGIRRFVL